MIKIITLAFDIQSQGFDDEPLQQFVSTNTIKQLKSEFFTLNGQAFWTVWIEYEPLLSVAEKQVEKKSYSPLQLKLLDDLKQWRREKAEGEKIPVYVIATNRELESIIETAPRTLEGLKMIHGFGRKKIERHGKEILQRVARFAAQVDDSAKSVGVRNLSAGWFSLLFDSRSQAP